MLFQKRLYLLFLHRLLLLYYFVQFGLLRLLLKDEIVSMTNLSTILNVVLYFIVLQHLDGLLKYFGSFLLR